MDLISLLLAGLLGGIAALHFMWALRISWPFSDQRSLAKAVVGTRGVEQMPSPLACAFVGVCLLGAGVWALLLREQVGMALPKLALILGGIALSAVFIGRGVFGLLPAMERFTPEQPFLRLNRRVYSPLCLLIGLGFLALVTSYPNWSWRLGLLG